MRCFIFITKPQICIYLSKIQMPYLLFTSYHIM